MRLPITGVVTTRVDRGERSQMRQAGYMVIAVARLDCVMNWEPEAQEMFFADVEGLGDPRDDWAEAKRYDKGGLSQDIRDEVDYSFRRTFTGRLT